VIINVASLAGIVGFPLLGAHCASKGACVRMTEVMALELRDHGVRANAICPGFIDTPMVDRATQAFEAATSASFDTVIARQGRLGNPDELAALALFPRIRSGGVHQRQRNRHRRRAQPPAPLRRDVMLCSSPSHEPCRARSPLPWAKKQGSRPPNARRFRLGSGVGWPANSRRECEEGVLKSRSTVRSSSEKPAQERR
jgi:Enoyl-(Acyl carrier protein) reductase